MIEKFRARLFAALALLLALAGCRREQGPKGWVLDTSARNRPVSLKLAPSDAQFSGTLGSITMRTVNRAVEALDGTIHESDIAKLNRIGADARIQISRDAYRLLDLARHYAVLSGGNYDFTTAPVAYLWGFEGAKAVTNVPADDVRQAAMLGIGPNNIAFFDNNMVTLTHQQTRVSADSLIEAYSADMVLAELRKKTIANAFVRVGNSSRAIGSDEGRAWTAPLPDPAGKLKELASVRMERSALAVVLPQSKTMTIEGRPYSYIIDPRSGRPVSGIAMAAVSGNIATKCGVVAHALAVAGVEGAPDVLKNFPGCEALIMPDGPSAVLWMTPGFAKQTDLPAALRDNVRTIEVPTAQ